MSRRLHALAGTLLLIGATAPAHAVLTSNSLSANSLSTNALAGNSLTCNSLTTNSLSSNALATNALVTTGAAVADLNGVAVEAISLPQSTRP